MGEYLTQGTELSAVWYEPDGEFVVGRHGVTKITVSMENGIGGTSPWFAIWYGDKVERLLNGTQVAGVKLKD